MARINHNVKVSLAIMPPSHGLPLTFRVVGMDNREISSVDSKNNV